MMIQSQYDEFEGKKSAQQGKVQGLMRCARWARGVVMVMEECRMKLRGTNPGQEAPRRSEERISSGAAHSC
jgi:hypothetical protein